jgi:hypothetical protein
MSSRRKIDSGRRSAPKNAPQFGTVDIAFILRAAQDAGANGFRGDCAAAAIAIRRKIFDGKAKLIAAFNKAFWQRGIPIGHVAVVAPNGFLWDMDGKPKQIYAKNSMEGIDHWGMLDLSDSDMIEQAAKAGFVLDDTTASEVEIVRLDEEALISLFNLSASDIETYEDEIEHQIALLALDRDLTSQISV